MNEQAVNRVSCEYMGPDKAVVVYEGAICHAGAAALIQMLESLFGYYHYRRVDLRLESPGGSVEAMNYMLRQIGRHEQEGRVVAVSTTFMCASAAAVLLAMGQWGDRRVDQSTALLFHTARVDSNLHGMTAAVSNSIFQTLLVADQRLVSMLVGRMLHETGSELALSELIRSRLQQVETDWSKLDCCLGLSKINKEGRARPDWARALAKIARPELQDGKFTVALKKHLYLRMQQDVRMDLREAYALCLIDEVEGVLSD